MNVNMQIEGLGQGYKSM